jgi:hypothetical protein
MMCASIAKFDFGAHFGEELASGSDVAHLRNVFKNHRLVREQRRRHAGERGILCAADADRPQQGIAASNYELIHIVMRFRKRAVEFKPSAYIPF